MLFQVLPCQVTCVTCPVGTVECHICVCRFPVSYGEFWTITRGVSLNTFWNFILFDTSLSVNSFATGVSPKVRKRFFRFTYDIGQIKEAQFSAPRRESSSVQSLLSALPCRHPDLDRDVGLSPGALSSSPGNLS